MPAGRRYDALLCYNHADRVWARLIKERLREYRLRLWIDEDDLPPGRSWQEEVELQIENIGAAVVLIGPNGFGKWQLREIRALLEEFTERNCPVIPALLPGAQISSLPTFLRSFNWVELREMDSKEIERLVWGITGRKPENPTKDGDDDDTR